MNIDYKTILISVIASVFISSFLIPTGVRLGSTIITTNSSDTLETFRTNVNSSLTSLQAFASSTNITGQTALIGGTASTTITAAGRIGIASTSPFGNLGIGAATATSTISGGFFCQYFRDEQGRNMFIKLSISGNTVFSTSTSPCNI